ncbi:MAG: methylenetetrahydrofolate reductase [NAD(P)H] [Thiomonas sp.]|uniref:methylenetetrahydrofolate reductase [NAD(P)H] n=1 Tax=Thiomonas sp. TaxID=2047785 RepID=UPI002A369D7F|nr:methylenetetrahydrofolate reductase [NAD(P)H] [Thiomonas sp.]MDY0329987.1 methylenetetrahydrofolate reductase [NAD(P)H] [Thiomonas sp.]
MVCAQSVSPRPSISFEFFPPKTPEGADKLRAVRLRLYARRPEFCSVTFGAGGSTQEGTLQTVRDILAEGVDAAPHLSCIGASRDSVRAHLQSFRAAGVRRIVALRGDLPSGYGMGGEFHHARDLVAFIRDETGNAFHIEVAAYPEMHPQARSPQDDMRHFADKVRAGANSAITQYFFNAAAYRRFVDDVRALGLDVPVVPGIMPITNSSQLLRFSEVCGAEIPRWIRLRLQSYGDDRESIRAFGREVVSSLCEELIASGAPGLHFYTLNQAEATLAVLDDLGR